MRRKFVDGMLSQCNRDYLNALIDYQRALQQRNAWLKQYARGVAQGNDMLAYFDDVLDKSGSYLFACRREWVNGFAPLLQEYYALLSGGSEQVGLVYESDLHREPLKLLLERSLSEDFRYQRTMRGVHRDDLQLLMNGQPIKSYGSQGQKKSFLFALKLAQYGFLKRQMHQNPILLLDDVFEKLDQQRMESLLHIIRGADFGQVILTDTHEERIRKAFSGNETELGIIRL
ncbi:MAG: DNA replication and repair protein RecF [Chitinophagaceae bacterium]